MVITPIKNIMRVSTGIEGLDQILRGGMLPGRVCLAHGEAGTGKTTLGLHFLAAGLAEGQHVLLITFGQPEENIRADAKALGLNLEGASILDLTPPPETFSEMQTYDIFSHVEIEREPMTCEITEAIQQSDPQRVFVDSFSQFRHLASDEFHHRRLVQSFFRFATRRGGTLLIASDDTDCTRDADCVIRFDFTRDGRVMRVTKFRGSDFQAGPHPMRLTAAGMQVLPNVA